MPRSVRGADPRERQVVINADDLGMSSDVNRAILAALESGSVSSTTIMANMPAFEAAAAAVLEGGLSDRVGVHLNLTQGPAITQGIRRTRFCDTDGALRHLPKPAWRLDAAELDAIAEELEAQVSRVKGAGIDPTHFDSHHHVHTQWPIAGIVIDLALRHRVAAVRIGRNCGPMRAWARSYKVLLNRRIVRAGLAATEYFGSLRDASVLGSSFRTLEIMVHPAISGDTVVDRGEATPLKDATRPWHELGDVVSYAVLRSE